MNKENLQLMADHIKTIDPELFDMDIYRRGDTEFAECNSIGCVIRHCAVLEEGELPRLPNGGIDFSHWSYKFTGLHTMDVEWEWCFGSSWSQHDNSIEGAVNRIEYLVNNESVPEGFDEDLLYNDTHEVDEFMLDVPGLIYKQEK